LRKATRDQTAAQPRAVDSDRFVHAIAPCGAILPFGTKDAFANERRPEGWIGYHRGPLARTRDMTLIANPPTLASLRDRVILVTGAAGGLGAPLARACAAQGATVVLHGRVVRKLEALYDEIIEAKHPEPIILPLDLAKATADDFGNVASALTSQLGRLDGLVHTAALLGTLGPIEHQSFVSWLSSPRPWASRAR
jgi:hypothetical protein